MGMFWNKNRDGQEKLDVDLESRPTIGTYGDFSESEFEFIIDTVDLITMSDEWHETQKQFIAWVRGLDLNEFPDHANYAELEDWQLAYLMDFSLTCDIEITAERFDTSEFKAGLTSNGLTLISMIYAARLGDANSHQRGVIVESALDLIKNATEVGSLELQGSMRRWLAQK